MDILLLTTPTQHLSDNPSVVLNEKKLRQRLDDTPVMNVLETVRYLEKIIVPFNEIKIAAIDRLNLLEVIHEYYDEILVSYDELRLSMLPVSVEERRKLSTDIMWLYLHLANGYKIIIKEYFDKTNGTFREQQILLCQYRAMEQIIHAMLNAFRSHENPPPLCYLELHQIYQFALQLGFDGKTIKKLKTTTTIPNIGALYRQFLLLVICDPFRIPGQIIVEYYLELEKFEKYLSLESEIDPAVISADNYFINPFEDAAPLPARLDKGINSIPGNYYFSVAPIISAMRQYCEKLNNGKEGYSKSEYNLLCSLVESISGNQKRRDKREESAIKVKLWLGMEATHYYLLDDERIYAALDSEVSGGIEVSELLTEEGAEFTLNDWVIENQSPRGYMISGQRCDIQKDNLIGDVVGIVAKGKPIPEIAIVRWERAGNEGSIKLGVEVLKGRSKLMLYTAKNEQPAHRGVCFVNQDNESLIVAVLLKKGLYEHGEKLYLNINDSRVTVTAGQALIQSPLYCLHMVRH